MTQFGLVYALPFLHLGHSCCFLVEQTLWCYWAHVLLSWVQNSPWFWGMDDCHQYFALTTKEVWLLPRWSVSFEEILNLNDRLFISSLPLSPPVPPSSQVGRQRLPVTTLPSQVGLLQMPIKDETIKAVSLSRLNQEYWKVPEILKALIPNQSTCS